MVFGMEGCEEFINMMCNMINVWVVKYCRDNKTTGKSSYG